MLAICFIASSCNTTSDEPYRLSDGDKALLLSGDIIMRRGEGFLSDIIVKLLNDSTGLSHCGIIERKGSDINVIHCLSDEVSDVDGVQSCTLDQFVSESVRGTIAVVRCKKDTAGCIVAGARYYLNTNKKFDHEFDACDTTKFFCSELPLRILADRMGINIIDENKNINFSMFFDTRYFEIILKHN